MKGTSHPGTQPTVASESQGNGEQYAFKEENIEGIYQNHLYVPNFLLPAGGAMTISGFWHVDLQESTLIKHMKFGADWT